MRGKKKQRPTGSSQGDRGPTEVESARDPGRLSSHRKTKAAEDSPDEADDAPPRDPLGAADAVAVKLGLPTGFLVRLLKEDDWTFALKVAVLLEGAVAHSLRHTFRTFDLSGFIDKLPHSKRLELAKKSRSLRPDLLAGLGHVANVRNLLAHDIRQVSFTFEKYYQDPARLNAFKSSVLVGEVDTTVELPNGTRAHFRNLLAENPKLAFVRFAIGVLAEVYLSSRDHELDANWRQALGELGGSPGETVM